MVGKRNLTGMIEVEGFDDLFTNSGSLEKVSVVEVTVHLRMFWTEPRSVATQLLSTPRPPPLTSS